MEQHNFLGIMHSVVTKGTLDTSTSKEDPYLKKSWVKLVKHFTKLSERLRRRLWSGKISHARQKWIK